MTISSSFLISDGVLVKCCLESASVWICVMFPDIRLWLLVSGKKTPEGSFLSHPIMSAVSTCYQRDIAGNEKRGPRPRSCLLDFYFAKLLLFPLITLLIGKQVTKCSPYSSGVQSRSTFLVGCIYIKYLEFFRIGHLPTFPIYLFLVLYHLCESVGIESWLW